MFSPDRYISATFKLSGSLELFIHDIGDLLVPLFGRNEYEYFLTVAESAAAKISIEELREGAKTHHGDMEKWLNSRGLFIDTHFTRYIR